MNLDVFGSERCKGSERIANNGKYTDVGEVGGGGGEEIMIISCFVG